ncbi:MAG: PQQ-dependent sugar dehydrogenase [Limisphaerales bacterium]
MKPLSLRPRARRSRVGKALPTGRRRPTGPSAVPRWLLVGISLLAGFAFPAFPQNPAGAAAPNAAFEPTPRPPWTGNRFAGSPLPPSPYTVERVFPKAEFRDATDLAFAPGTSLLFVGQQDGKVLALDASRPDAEPRLALDLRATGRATDNLLGLTVHPGFATNRYVFINYNGPGNVPDSSRVSRFTVRSLNPPTIDPDTERTVIRWPGGGHNGCSLAFGPDGMLYISTGDGADPDPPDGRFKTGQDLSDLLAAILRIDVDTPESGAPYRVPSDNPFVDLPKARPEIWSFGYRNPFRIAFGPDGSLWAADVGWEQWEMVYRVAKGGNYGWPLTEGPNRRVRNDLPPGPGPILPPMHSVPHTDGASITGGQVYRGTRLPGLTGAYVYGDWETGRFWALRNDGDRLLANLELCDTPLKPVAFAVQSDGDVLILDYHAGLYRFVTNSAPDANRTFPRKLSESGLAASLVPFTPASGVVPYSVRAPMWNDHAVAEWWMGIPGNGAIATEGGVGNIAGATWFFPSNTVLARTLSLEMRANDPSSSRRIETQVLHWDGQAWNPYSYRWNPEATDADLVDVAGTNTVLTVADAGAPGGVRPTPWRFMSRGECLRCHNAWAGEALTLNPLQLGAPTPPPRPRGRPPRSAPATNPTTTGPGPETSEFVRLTRIGALRGEARRGRPVTLVDPHDTDAPLEDRARSWLHANCSACHRFGAGGAAALRLNREEAPEQLRIFDVRPTRGDYALAGARIVAPGDPWRSTLLYRIATEGAGRMPHIGSRLVDEQGLAPVRDWIRSLPEPTADPKPSSDDRIALARTRALKDLIRENAVSDLESMSRLLADMNGALAAVVEPGRAQRLPALQNAANAHTNALVRDLLQRYLSPDRRRETLGTDIQPGSILARAGDPKRGRELFEGPAQCTRCHARGGVGRAFGPELKGLGTKYSRAQLLEQILDPSAIVAPEFRTVSVTLRDDSEVIGFVTDRAPGRLVVREESLTERTLLAADIVEARDSTLSAMPEGMLAPLTAQEAADLLEYLLKD